MTHFKIVNQEGVDITDLLTYKYVKDNDVPIVQTTKEDRKYSTKGWQYRHFGNTNEGSDYLKSLLDGNAYTLISNEIIDHNPRKDHSTHHTEYVFESDDVYIHIKVSSSHSGATTTYKITKVNKDDLGI